MPQPGEAHRVELRLPAEGAYVSVLRTTTAALAARLDFTLDDVEDLRMAVGEAAALCLDSAVDDAELLTTYALEERSITVTVEARTTDPAVDENSFAWQVLTSLADQVTATADGDRLRISLVAQATPLEPAG